MPNLHFGYNNVKLATSLAMTKELHNGVGYDEFVTLRRELLRGEITKTELMARMHIKSYTTINKILRQAELEDK